MEEPGHFTEKKNLKNKKYTWKKDLRGLDFLRLLSTAASRGRRGSQVRGNRIGKAWPSDSHPRMVWTSQAWPHQEGGSRSLAPVWPDPERWQRTLSLQIGWGQGDGAPEPPCSKKG